MKYFFLALSLPLSAWAVDYSRCSFPYEVSVDPEGRVTASQWYEASNIVTEGRRTTMTVRLNNSYGQPNEPKRVVIERDEQNRIISVTAGGDRPSDETIRRYRQGFGGYPGGSIGGLVGGVSTGSRLGPNFGSQGLDFLVPVRRNGTTQMVAARDLTDSDLQTIGVRNVRAEQLKSGVQERTRNSQTQRAMQQIESYAQFNYPFSIPVGTSQQYSYVDNTCAPDKMSTMAYSSATDRVEANTFYDREDCQHVKAGWDRHVAKLNECRNYENNEVSIEYNRLVADGHIQPQQWGLVGGMTGGGFSQGGSVGGYGGLSGGGFPGGAGGGWGYSPGMMSYNPYGFQSPRQLLENNYNMCKMYEQSWNNIGTTGGFAQGGSSSGSAIGF
jgi:hypothetical protein